MLYYAQNPVFKIVQDESVKVYLHTYNGNVQQNPLCVESCVTKEFSISPRFSPTIFDPDAISVLLGTHLCPVADSKSCVQNCSREREGLYNGNVQQNSLCAAYCVNPSLLDSRLSRCESLVLYRIMYGNRFMEVQRRNNFVANSDNTEIISWGRGVCWGHGGIKLNK